MATRSEPFALIDGVEGVGIHASSADSGGEHPLSFKLARVLISRSAKGLLSLAHRNSASLSWEQRTLLTEVVLFS